MANADATTNIYTDSLRYTDIHYSDMAGALANIDFSRMDDGECLMLSWCCDETRAGLCHCLAFLGDLLAKGDANLMSENYRCQIAHTLTTISQLVPALTDLSQFVMADLRGRGAVLS